MSHKCVHCIQRCSAWESNCYEVHPYISILWNGIWSKLYCNNYCPNIDQYMCNFIMNNWFRWAWIYAHSPKCVHKGCNLSWGKIIKDKNCIDSESISNKKFISNKHHLFLISSKRISCTQWIKMVWFNSWQSLNLQPV